MTSDKKTTTKTDEKAPDDESMPEAPATEADETTEAAGTMRPNNRHQTIEAG